MVSFRVDHGEPRVMAPRAPSKDSLKAACLYKKKQVTLYSLAVLNCTWRCYE